MNLNGKTAIVTGSTRGIGRAIARHLGHGGANVVLNGRDRRQLQDTYRNLLIENINVLPFQGDMSVMDDCREMVELAVQNFGSIDILVNNVGVGSRGFFENTCPEVFRKLLNVNVLGSVYPTMEALPHIKSAGGSILFISSLAGFRGMPNKCPYSMTKMAQTAIAESLHAELTPAGVHVGVVYVGITKNDPEKRVLVEDGSWTGLVERKHMFVDSQDDVAKSVLRAIRGRHFKTILGANGKMYYFLQKFAPWFVDYTFRNSLQFIKEKDV